MLNELRTTNTTMEMRRWSVVVAFISSALLLCASLEQTLQPVLLLLCAVSCLSLRRVCVLSCLLMFGSSRWFLMVFLVFGGFGGRPINSHPRGASDWIDTSKSGEVEASLFLGVG